MCDYIKAKKKEPDQWSISDSFAERGRGLTFLGFALHSESMKEIGKILFGIVGLVFVGLLAVGAAATRLPDEYQIQRSVEVQSSLADLWKRVGSIKKWESWSPWKSRDPSVQNVYAGASFGAGATQSWTSEKSGQGTLVFNSVLVDGVENASDPAKPISANPKRAEILYSLSFKGWNSISKGAVELTSIDPKTTRVQWTMKGKRAWGEKVVWTLFQMQESIEKDFDLGLSLLKKQGESGS